MIKTSNLLFAFAIAIVLTVPTLIKDGMFMDAMLYTSVSHNLAHGIGTFWFPQFSLHNLAGLSSFHEQPPLVFGIQSLFFRLLGDSLYVERFYVFVTLIVHALLIMKIWRMIFPDSNSRNIAGLPVVLWIGIPVCFWSFSNNMHENTMSIFILCAFLFMFKDLKDNTHRITNSIIAAVFIFLAALSKGIPGFFPFGIPILWWIIFGRKDFLRYFKQTLTIFITVALLFALLLLWNDARESLYIYLTKRALNRINELPTVDSRFYILGRIFSELIPHLALLLIYFLSKGIKKATSEIRPDSRLAIFFLATGFAGSVPLMLTLVQKGFYFVPSLPYFGIGFAILLKSPVLRFMEFLSANEKRKRNWRIAALSVFIIPIGISISQIGKFSREKELLNDISRIATVVPDHAVLSVTPDMWGNWSLQCYMMRYHFISLEDRKSEKFYLVNVSDSYQPGPEYTAVPLELKQFRLYQK